MSSLIEPSAMAWLPASVSILIFIIIRIGAPFSHGGGSTLIGSALRRRRAASFGCAAGVCRGRLYDPNPGVRSERPSARSVSAS